MKTLIAIMVALAAFASLTTDGAEAADMSRATVASAAVVAVHGPTANDVHYHYQVLYHHGHHWYVYGTYATYHAAHHVSNRLQHHGYHTRIRAIF